MNAPQFNGSDTRDLDQRSPDADMQCDVCRARQTECWYFSSDRPRTLCDSCWHLQQGSDIHEHEMHMADIAEQDRGQR